MEKKGQVILVLEDLKKISEHIKEDLEEVDGLTASLEDYLLSGKIDEDTIMEKVKIIRQKIGKIEEEEATELKDEDVTESIIQKLDSLIGKCLDFK